MTILRGFVAAAVVPVVFVAVVVFIISVPAGAGNFSLHHRVQTGSGAHPASYPTGTRGSFPGAKAAGL
jgi:hypothetical protein